MGNWRTVNITGTMSAADAELRNLVHIAPSMLLKVHCGGEYESDECVATILVGEGLVAVRPPEQPTVAGPSEAQVLGNFIANLYR